MTLQEFMRALNGLQSIDRGEFIGADIDAAKWMEFCANPTLWFLRASDGDVEKMWGIIQRLHLKAKHKNAKGEGRRAAGPHLFDKERPGLVRRSIAAHQAGVAEKGGGDMTENTKIEWMQ
jgi:hypothetical protein